MCDCCDHPLEHIIWEAIETYRNAVPPLKVKSVFDNMEIQLENWKDSQ